MELAEAIALVHQRNSILLLGAGFSVPSLNLFNHPMPTASELRASLAANLSVENKYPLPVLVSAFLRREGSVALTDLLRRQFTAKTISPDQSRIALLPWRRIYSLNYDNVVETIYNQNRQLLRSLTAESPLRSADQPTQCVHLHGELYSGDASAESIILSSESYNSIELYSGWFATLRSDMEIADSLVVVGCSMSDLHLSSLFFRDPAIQGKTFFIEQLGLDPILGDNLAMYGSVCPIGLPRLADYISQVGQPRSPKRNRPVSLELFSLPLEPRTANGNDVFDLVLLGDIKSDILTGPIDAASVQYILHREDIKSIVKRLDISADPIRCVIHSDLGNGKTMALHSLCAALAQRGWTVLTLKLLRDVVSADMAYLRALSGRVVVIVEDIFRTNNRRDLTMLVQEFPRFSFVGTCRTTIYEIQGHELGLILGAGYDDFDLNCLSNAECSQISDWFERNGLWGDQARLSPEEKLRILVSRCKREFRSIILDRFNSPFMKERISSAFQHLEDGRVKRWLLVVLILELCGFEPNPRLVRELTGFSITKSDLDEASSVREFVDSGGLVIRVRSPVLASVLVSQIYTGKIKISVLASIAKACDRLTNGRDVYAELLKFMYRPAIMRELFAGVGYLDAVKDVFDQLKELDSLRRKSLFLASVRCCAYQ